MDTLDALGSALVLFFLRRVKLNRYTVCIIFFTSVCSKFDVKILFKKGQATQFIVKCHLAMHRMLIK